MVRRFLGLDIESTGLDVEKDRILKLGVILYEENNPVPLVEKEWTLFSYHYPEIQAAAFAVHGITLKSMQEFGTDPGDAFEELAVFMDQHRVDYLVAHNGHAFDFPMLISSSDAFSASLLNTFRNWKKIDTMTDLPHSEKVQTRKLSYLAAEHGFLNPFPHSTLSDVRTMFKIFFQYPLEKILERAHSSPVRVQAIVSYEARDLAKKRRFSWDETARKWIKNIKACDLEYEKQNASFEIVTLN